MKNQIFHLFLLCTFFLPVTAYAVPPYLGISVGENLSFNNSTCVDIAKEALRQNGFDKVVQYKSSATVFAAYRNDNPYHYKAVVKCLATSGSIIVVAVANIPRDAKKKADELRWKIQKHNSIKRQSTQESASDPSDTQEESQEVTILESSTPESTSAEITTSGKTSEAWHETVLSLNDCLIRAESSLRDSGFYKNIEFDENSAYGQHQKGYDGAVHCLTTENEVLFQVTGAHLSTRKQLLETLQRKF
jgi:hypothetical protein